MSVEEIGQSIQVRHLMASLSRKGTVSISLPQDQAKKQLGQNFFDYGVVEEGGKIVGIVPAGELGEISEAVGICNAVRRLELDYLIPEMTPISDLLEYLAAFPFHLVVRGKKVVGLVHVSDLNKHPVYSYLYLLISRLEQDFLRLVSEQFPETEQWRGLLDPGSWGRIDARWQQAVRGVRQLPALHYAGFPDFLSIIRKCPEITTGLGFSTANEWDDCVKHMTELRNDVMHPVKDLVGEYRSVSELAALHQRITNLAVHVGSFLSKTCVSTQSADWEDWEEM